MAGRKQTTTPRMSVNQPWEPLGMLDYFVLGMVSTFQLVALGVCVHLVKCRKWPPYLTKNVDVVIISVSQSLLNSWLWLA